MPDGSAPVDIDVTSELRELTQTFAAYAALREELGERVDLAVVSVSRWSIAQHLYHIALASDLAFRNVKALVRGSGGRIVHEGGPNDLALQVLRAGGYPRGESEAPRMVRPGDLVDPEFLATELKGNRATLPELEELAAQMHAATGRILHPDLGELCAVEWLRFSQIHARHHLAIVRDVATALE